MAQSKNCPHCTAPDFPYLVPCVCAPPIRRGLALALGCLALGAACAVAAMWWCADVGGAP